VNFGVREILGVKSFLTFKTALQYLMKQRGMKFQTIKE
jgi:hypothetical protein